mgnify:CR=1 FL=1
MDDDDRLTLSVSISQFGETTDIYRSHAGDVSWTDLMTNFITVLNAHGYLIGSHIVEIDERGNVVSSKHRGRGNTQEFMTVGGD